MARLAAHDEGCDAEVAEHRGAWPEHQHRFLSGLVVRLSDHKDVGLAHLLCVNPAD
jgi:hypothetical protein